MRCSVNVRRTSACHSNEALSDHAQFCANLTFLFNELGSPTASPRPRKRASKASSTCRRTTTTETQLAEQLKKHGLAQVLHQPAGGRLGERRARDRVPSRPRRRVPGRRRASDRIRDGARLQAGELPRGHLSPTRRDDRQRAAFVRNLKFAALKLKEAGIKLLIEPINTRRHPRLLSRRARGRRSRSSTKSARTISFCSTTSITCRSWKAISRARSKRTSRGSPTCSSPTTPAATSRARARSTTPFLFGHIDRIGYKGWIGCEYKPKTTTDDGLGWAQAARSDRGAPLDAPGGARNPQSGHTPRGRPARRRQFQQEEFMIRASRIVAACAAALAAAAFAAPASAQQLTFMTGPAGRCVGAARRRAERHVGESHSGPADHRPAGRRHRQRPRRR